MIRPARGVSFFNMKPNFCYLNTPCGWLKIEDDGKFLLSVHFTPAPQQPQGEVSFVGNRAVRQLKAYFEGKRPVFDLPLAPAGTPFQQAVWRQLSRIPYGQTRTYAQIAAAVGRPKAARAVGQACHVNPWGVVIPCHRVVGAAGKLTGYAGGIDKKQWLLAWEQNG